MYTTVIAQIKELLASSRENVNLYNFTIINNIIHMKKNNICVTIKYLLFTPEDITSKTKQWIDYLREKLNNLFDIINKPCIIKTNKDVYVLVHGAWHTGKLLEKTACYLRKKGNIVYTPTLKGNKPGDDRSIIGLNDAIQSIVDYILEFDLNNIILLGHSYGGMVISGVIDNNTVRNRIKRLIYWNAFVPLNGQSLNDMVPASYNSLFNTLASQNNNAVLLPFQIWREAFTNNSNYTDSVKYHNQLNYHPYLTFTDKIHFTNFNELAELNVGKSYIYGYTDAALPQNNGWLLLSNRLGLFRLVVNKYDHEMCFSEPEKLAQDISDAGRD